MKNKKQRILKFNKMISDIKKNLKNGELTSAKACILIACEPTVKYFIDNIIPELPEYINIEKTKQMIKNIEKAMFYKNLYRKKRIVIGVALLLANNLSQLKARKISGCSENSLRSLLKQLSLFYLIKKPKEPEPDIFDSYLY